jgi:hypothetical protein
MSCVWFKNTMGAYRSNKQTRPFFAFLRKDPADRRNFKWISDGSARAVTLEICGISSKKASIVISLSNQSLLPVRTWMRDAGSSTVTVHGHYRNFDHICMYSRVHSGTSNNRSNGIATGFCFGILHHVQRSKTFRPSISVG